MLVPELLAALELAPDAAVWNSAALALADLGAPEGHDAIVAMIRDERTSGSRGTLLYALEIGFDFSGDLDLLLEVVSSDAFEARMHAAIMIDFLMQTAGAEERAIVIRRLARKLPKVGADIRDGIEALIEHLSDR